MVSTLLALAFASAAAAVLGPLGLGWIEWRVGPNAINQTYGADAATLLFVVPAALAAAWLWWRRHRLAPPLALGVGLATIYYSVASALGADYVQYAGNNERYFLLFLALTVLGWTSAARAWAALDRVPPLPPRRLARSLAVVLLAGGALIGVAWMAQLIEIAGAGRLSAPAACRRRPTRGRTPRRPAPFGWSAWSTWASWCRPRSQPVPACGGGAARRSRRRTPSQRS